MLVQFRHLPPNTYQDHKSESSTHYHHLASIAAGFLKRITTKNQTQPTHC
ncbi:hypothetical protein NLN92_00650 [Citrobacter portucalensis]|nr:hypothetical protein [Citrobacter portucalensis]MCX8976523.1 hypothetical protein [Citrobacter portucalensis]